MIKLPVDCITTPLGNVTEQEPVLTQLTVLFAVDEFTKEQVVKVKTKIINNVKNRLIT